MQLIDGAPFLNVNTLFLLFAAAHSAAVFITVIDPLACMLHHYNEINLIISLKF